MFRYIVIIVLIYLHTNASAAPSWFGANPFSYAGSSDPSGNTSTGNLDFSGLQTSLISPGINDTTNGGWQNTGIQAVANQKMSFQQDLSKGVTINPYVYLVEYRADYRFDYPAVFIYTCNSSGTSCTPDYASYSGLSSTSASSNTVSALNSYFAMQNRGIPVYGGDLVNLTYPNLTSSMIDIGSANVSTTSTYLNLLELNTKSGHWSDNAMFNMSADEFCRNNTSLIASGNFSTYCTLGSNSLYQYKIQASTTDGLYNIVGGISPLPNYSIPSCNSSAGTYYSFLNPIIAAITSSSSSLYLSAVNNLIRNYLLLGGTFSNIRSTYSSLSSKPSSIDQTSYPYLYQLANGSSTTDTTLQTAAQSTTLNYCLQDQGSGLEIDVGTTIVKPARDTFIPIITSGVTNYVYSFTSQGSGLLGFRNTAKINSGASYTFDSFDPRISSTNASSTPYSSFISSSNKMNGFNFGRYLLEVRIGRGSEYLSNVLSNLEYSYYIQPSGGSSPTSSTSGTVFGGFGQFPAPSSGTIWVKVASTDTNVTGKAYMKVQSYAGSQVLSKGLNDYVVKPILTQFASAMRLIYDGPTGLINNMVLIKIVKTAAILYIIIFAIYFLFGNVKITVEELVSRIVKITLTVNILFSSQSWAFFNTYLFDTILRGTNYLILVFTGQDANSMTPFTFLDPIFNVYTSPAFWGSILAQLPQIWNGLTFVAIITLMGIGIFLTAVFEVVMTYVLGFITIYILIGIAPLFIPLMLFSATSQFFYNWIKTLVKSMLLPAIFIVLILTFNTFINQVLSSTVVSNHWGCLKQLSIHIPLGGKDLTFLENNPGFCLPFYIPNLTSAYNTSSQSLLNNLQNVTTADLQATAMSGAQEATSNVSSVAGTALVGYMTVIRAAFLYFTYAIVIRRLLGITEQIVGQITGIQATVFSTAVGQMHETRSQMQAKAQNIAGSAYQKATVALSAVGRRLEQNIGSMQNSRFMAMRGLGRALGGIDSTARGASKLATGLGKGLNTLGKFVLAKPSYDDDIIQRPGRFVKGVVNTAKATAKVAIGAGTFIPRKITEAITKSAFRNSFLKKYSEDEMLKNMSEEDKKKFLQKEANTYAGERWQNLKPSRLLNPIKLADEMRFSKFKDQFKDLHTAEGRAKYREARSVYAAEKGGERLSQVFSQKAIDEKHYMQKYKGKFTDLHTTEGRAALKLEAAKYAGEKAQGRSISSMLHRMSRRGKDEAAFIKGNKNNFDRSTVEGRSALRSAAKGAATIQMEKRLGESFEASKAALSKKYQNEYMQGLIKEMGQSKAERALFEGKFDPKAYADDKLSKMSFTDIMKEAIQDRATANQAKTSERNQAIKAVASKLVSPLVSGGSYLGQGAVKSGSAIASPFVAAGSYVSRRASNFGSAVMERAMHKSFKDSYDDLHTRYQQKMLDESRKGGASEKELARDALSDKSDPAAKASAVLATMSKEQIIRESAKLRAAEKSESINKNISEKRASVTKYAGEVRKDFTQNVNEYKAWGGKILSAEIQKARSSILQDANRAITVSYKGALLANKFLDKAVKDEISTGLKLAGVLGSFALDSIIGPPPGLTEKQQNERLQKFGGDLYDIFAKSAKSEMELAPTGFNAKIGAAALISPLAGAYMMYRANQKLPDTTQSKTIALGLINPALGLGYLGAAGGKGAYDFVKSKVTSPEPQTRSFKIGIDTYILQESRNNAPVLIKTNPGGPNSPGILLKEGLNKLALGDQSVSINVSSKKDLLGKTSYTTGVNFKNTSFIDGVQAGILGYGRSIGGISSPNTINIAGRQNSVFSAYKGRLEDGLMGKATLTATDVRGKTSVITSHAFRKVLPEIQNAALDMKEKSRQRLDQLDVFKDTVQLRSIGKSEAREDSIKRAAKVILREERKIAGEAALGNIDNMFKRAEIERQKAEGAAKRDARAKARSPEAQRARDTKALLGAAELFNKPEREAIKVAAKFNKQVDEAIIKQRRREEHETAVARKAFKSIANDAAKFGLERIAKRQKIEAFEGFVQRTNTDLSSATKQLEAALGARKSFETEVKLFNKIGSAPGKIEIGEDRQKLFKGLEQTNRDLLKAAERFKELSEIGRTRALSKDEQREFVTSSLNIKNAGLTGVKATEQLNKDSDSIKDQRKSLITKLHENRAEERAIRQGDTKDVTGAANELFGKAEQGLAIRDAGREAAQKAQERTAEDLRKAELNQLPDRSGPEQQVTPTPSSNNQPGVGGDTSVPSGSRRGASSIVTEDVRMDSGRTDPKSEKSNQSILTITATASEPNQQGTKQQVNPTSPGNNQPSAKGDTSVPSGSRRGASSIVTEDVRMNSGRTDPKSEKSNQSILTTTATASEPNQQGTKQQVNPTSPGNNQPSAKGDTSVPSGSRRGASSIVTEDVRMNSGRTDPMSEKSNQSTLTAATPPTPFDQAQGISAPIIRPTAQSAPNINAQFNQVNDKGQTELHRIALADRDTAARASNNLLNQGADLNIRDSQGKTALEYAVANSNQRLVKALLNGGAEPFNAQGQPLRIEVAKGLVLENINKQLTEAQNKFEVAKTQGVADVTERRAAMKGKADTQLQELNNKFAERIGAQRALKVEKDTERKEAAFEKGALIKQKADRDDAGQSIQVGIAGERAAALQRSITSDKLQQVVRDGLKTQQDVKEKALIQAKADLEDHKKAFKSGLNDIVGVVKDREDRMDAEQARKETSVKTLQGFARNRAAINDAKKQLASLRSERAEKVAQDALKQTEIENSAAKTIQAAFRGFSERESLSERRTEASIELTSSNIEALKQMKKELVKEWKTLERNDKDTSSMRKDVNDLLTKLDNSREKFDSSLTTYDILNRKKEDGGFESVDQKGLIDARKDIQAGSKDYNNLLTQFKDQFSKIQEERKKATEKTMRDAESVYGGKALFPDPQQKPKTAVQTKPIESLDSPREDRGIRTTQTREAAFEKGALIKQKADRDDAKQSIQVGIAEERAAALQRSMTLDKLQQVVRDGLKTQQDIKEKALTQAKADLEDHKKAFAPSAVAIAESAQLKSVKEASRNDANEAAKAGGVNIDQRRKTLEEAINQDTRRKEDRIIFTQEDVKREVKVTDPLAKLDQTVQPNVKSAPPSDNREPQEITRSSSQDIPRLDSRESFESIKLTELNKTAIIGRAKQSNSNELINQIRQNIAEYNAIKEAVDKEREKKGSLPKKGGVLKIDDRVRLASNVANTVERQLGQSNYTGATDSNSIRNLQERLDKLIDVQNEIREQAKRLGIKQIKIKKPKDSK